MLRVPGFTIMHHDLDLAAAAVHLPTRECFFSVVLDHDRKKKTRKPNLNLLLNFLILGKLVSLVGHYAGDAKYKAKHI